MSVASGKKCVEMVADICQQLCYSVYVSESEPRAPWDMKVNGFKVQVKLRESTRPQIVNWLYLKTYMSPKVVAYRRGDFDVLVTLHCDSWYVVPFDVIASPGGDLRNGIYVPSLRQWMDRWDVLDGERVAYAQQKTFDF